MNFLFHLGRYALFVRDSFRRPIKHRVFVGQVLKEMDILGLSSVGIVAIISFFMGAVITLQLAYNLELPFIPSYTLGVGARDTMLLEFSSTMVSLILAGKVGSHIASQIGTMRVTEQIDALDAMGINSAAYLVMPKVIGLMVVVPLLVILSIFIGLIGGWFIAVVGNLMTTNDYLFGIRFNFDSYKVLYTLVKSFVFAFLITSIAGYHGYYTKGGALEVGRSSTLAVVYGMISILIANYLITQIMLS